MKYNNKEVFQILVNSDRINITLDEDKELIENMDFEFKSIYEEML